ncbi:MAG: FtsX-like permease family protein, partial [Acidobacteriota bacterium]
GDVRHGLAVNQALSPAIYVPWEQLPQPALSVALKTSGDPTALGDVLRREVRAFDPTVTLALVQTLDDFVDQFWAGQKVFTVILRAFGGLALLLAALGTYGVLAYAVTQRRQEIGVRIALGAGRGQVVGMVLRQGLTLAAIGIVCGMPLLFMVNRGLTTVMDGFVPMESAPIAVGAMVLVVATFFASLVPALRASGVDPMIALREE